MPRLLIADRSKKFASKIKECLKTECEIRICGKGQDLFSALHDFEPDVLLYDTMFHGVGVGPILHLLYLTGRKCKVVALTYLSEDFILAGALDPDNCSVLIRPCDPIYAANCIREQLFKVQHPNPGQWCLENEIDSILLSLGFRMGPNRYRCVFEAVRLRFYNPDCSMKELYIDVAKSCGGGSQRVEKAIRDAVEDAYTYGTSSLWGLYFSGYTRREKPYPGNEDFVARIAGALTQVARIHKPCSEPRTGTQ